MRVKNRKMSRRSFSSVLTDKNQNEYANQERHSMDSDSLAEMDVLLVSQDHFKDVEIESTSMLMCKSRKHSSEFERENFYLKEPQSEKAKFGNVRDDAVLFRRHQSPQPTGIDYFSVLSDEIILHIFKLLPKPVLVKCSSVCKRWQELSYDETLWKRHDFGRKVVRSGTLEILLKRRVLVLRLAMAEIRPPVFTDAYLNIYPWRCNLQYLDLSMAMVSTQCLSDLLSKCCSLKKLSVEHCTLNEECCISIAENNELETLNTTMCEGFTPAGLQAISLCCKNLKEWSLAWTKLSEDCMDAFLHCLPTNLQRFNISGHRETLTDAALIKVVKRCRNLKELDISDCSLLSHISFEVLVKYCQHLQHLHTSRSYNIPTESNRLLKSLKQFKNLEIFQTLTDGALAALRAYLPNIAINKHMFSTIARPTVGIRRSSVWEIPTRD
ncbi:S-phase kinase-associated protein 2 [Parasteatoda tepidariorum]|nr:S-phase kinase-associated protein 2 [Parasteatoda tepidariorum]XP_042896651.1 S-phase kinase-associated protein 2 [Parasteatoda tepidariorum]